MAALLVHAALDTGRAGAQLRWGPRWRASPLGLDRAPQWLYRRRTAVGEALQREAENPLNALSATTLIAAAVALADLVGKP